MTNHNPVNQQRAINRIDRNLSIRLDRARKKIMPIVRGIPRLTRQKVDIQNDKHTSTFTDYEITPQEIEQLQIAIDAILNDELLDNPEGTGMPQNWYYRDDIEQPYRAGTLEEINESSRLIEAAIIAGIFRRRIEPRVLSDVDILFSQQYQQALEKVYVENYGFIKTLSKRTSGQVYQVIQSGIDSKLNITDISEEIRVRFDVAKSSSNRIAQTEVNRAFNDAKVNAGAVIEAETGVKTAVRHISALLSTTRPHHAARHQKVYTREAQQAWWNSGVNRINCFCSIKTVLLDGKSKPIAL